jgi:hypothetical protein
MFVVMDEKTLAWITVGFAVLTIAAAVYSRIQYRKTMKAAAAARAAELRTLDALDGVRRLRGL